MTYKRITGFTWVLTLIMVLLFALPQVPLYSAPISLRDSLVDAYESSIDEAAKFSILKQLSRASIQAGDYLSAIEYLDQEVEAYLEKKDSISWANAQYNLGMVYSIMRNFETATYHSSLALIYFERENYQREAGNTYVNLGYISNQLRQTKTAIGYYKRAEEIFTSIMSHGNLEASYLNIGILDDIASADVGGTGNRDVAQNHSGHSDKIALTAIRLNLGIIYGQSEDLVSAEKYLLSALQMAVELGSKSNEAIIRVHLGSVYLKNRKKDKEALSYLDTGLVYAQQLKLNDVMLEAYSQLAGWYIKKGKTALAYEYLNSYIHLKDSLYNEQYKQRLTHGISRSGIGARELQEERLLRQNLEQSLQIERNSNSKVALLGFALFTLLLLIVIFKKFYSRTKTYENLEEKNKLIELQKTELENLNATKDKFLSIIAHDLKNPFTSLLGFADLAYNEFDEISDAEKRSYLNIIRTSSQQIYSLLDNLLSWSRAQTGRIDFNPEKISLSELVENSIDVVQSSADNKQITLFKDFANEVVVSVDKNMIFTVLRNLLTNAIKFTPNGGSVTVNFNRVGSKAEIAVIDTGIGMSKEELSRLFRLDGNLKFPGTNNETGTGLGLILCQEFMLLHQSKIEVESVKGEGSRFSFMVDIE